MKKKQLNTITNITDRELSRFTLFHSPEMFIFVRLLIYFLIYFSVPVLIPTKDLFEQKKTIILLVLSSYMFNTKYTRDKSQ